MAACLNKPATHNMDALRREEPERSVRQIIEILELAGKRRPATAVAASLRNALQGLSALGFASRRRVPRVLCICGVAAVRHLALRVLARCTETGSRSNINCSPRTMQGLGPGAVSSQGSASFHLPFGRPAATGFFRPKAKPPSSGSSTTIVPQLLSAPSVRGSV